MKAKNPTFQQLLARPSALIAFGFGSGLSRKAPGTVGTLASIPLFLLFAQLPLWAFWSVVLVSFLFGVWICDQTGKWLGVDDHGGIVWDEFVGYWITGGFILFAVTPQLLDVLVSFILFRLFDIWKPFPIRYLDRHVKGGFGVMIDDVLAGLFAGVILLALIRAGVCPV